MKAMHHWMMIEEGLRAITLPPLAPTIRPDDDPAEGLAIWGATMYAYSAIAHVRKILAGLVVLANAGNTPTADVVCRHVFEWAASACYVEQNLDRCFKDKQWKLAFQLLRRFPGEIFGFETTAINMMRCLCNWRRRSRSE
jgi:hypothetical protein